MTIQQSENKRDESPQKAIVHLKEKNDEHLRESNIEVYDEEEAVVNTVEKDFEKRLKEVSLGLIVSIKNFNINPVIICFSDKAI